MRYVFWNPITSVPEFATDDAREASDFINDPFCSTEPLAVEVWNGSHCVRTELFHVQPNQLN